MEFLNEQREIAPSIYHTKGSINQYAGGNKAHLSLRCTISLPSNRKY